MERNPGWPTSTHGSSGDHRHNGESVQLEVNGWQALLAYLIGPPCVRQIVQLPHVVTGQERYADGTVSSWVRDATREEIEIVHRDMVDYLREMHVPPPPRNVQWILDLPGGLLASQFWEVVNGFSDRSVPPGYGDTDPPSARAERSRLERQLDELWSELDDSC